MRIAPPQRGPAAWRGSDLEAVPERWTMCLTDAHVAEVLAASAAAVTSADGAVSDAGLATITADDFPLPTLGPELRALRSRLTAGLGFELVRGLPVRGLPRAQVAAAFLGIGAHLGSARSQNASGHLLGHVRDVGLDPSDHDVRIYQTSARQSFHTDSTDVVGLLCLETALAGGTSLLASAATIYNEMLARAPELAARLFEPVATDRRGEVAPGQRPWFEIPVLSWYEGFLTVLYQRQYIESARRFDGAVELAPDTIAALDLFDAIAEDPAIHLTMSLDVGDMQFVHNHGVLHDRTAFVNRPGSPRHLLRLWLSVPGDRPLPPSFAARYGTTTVGDRGGIVTGAAAPDVPPWPGGEGAVASRRVPAALRSPGSGAR